jgi:hypothetical protein
VTTGRTSLASGSPASRAGAPIHPQVLLSAFSSSSLHLPPASLSDCPQHHPKAGIAGGQGRVGRFEGQGEKGGDPERKGAREMPAQPLALPQPFLSHPSEDSQSWRPCSQRLPGPFLSLSLWSPWAKAAPLKAPRVMLVEQALKQPAGRCWPA